ncbi:MAG: NAD(P)/FAD-dependent oxidoreductase [Chloroflexota bacterium]
MYDIIIVGAGAAGIGMGAVFRDMGLTNFTLIDRHKVGASFARWPQQMRFITPSFTSNGFGLLDLNAVTHTTSPAFSLQQEHLSGAEYASYLRSVADHYQLPIQTEVDVAGVQTLDANGNPCEPAQTASFLLETSAGILQSHFLVWAAGEFQYPNLVPFDGGEYCIHNAVVRDWGTADFVVNGDEFIVIGGYESGIDAAINLVQLGKRVRVLDDYSPWEFAGPDPSLVLSPYTLGRLRSAMETGQLELMKTGVVSIERNRAGAGVTVHTTDDQVLHTDSPPVLATGFTGSLPMIEHLLERHPEGGYVWLTQEADESRRTPGLFLSGPFVRHGNLIFCFIYKFRQRFAIIANAIGTRLGMTADELDAVFAPYRRYQMFLDDLDCCDDECVC